MTRAPTSGARTPVTRSPIVGTRSGLVTPAAWPVPSVVEPVGVFPPLMTLEYWTTPAKAAPVYNVVDTDPRFGTEIIRVNPATGQAHAYSTRAPWSKNRKWLGLFQGSPKLLLDGRTYEVIDSGVDPGGGFQWSHTDEDLGFAFGAPAQFRVYSADAVAGWSLENQHNIVALSGTYEGVRLGGGYGAQSLDDALWAYGFKKTDGWHGVGVGAINVGAMTFTPLVERSLIYDPAATVQQRFGSVHISPSGQYVYASARGPGTLYHASNLATIGQITSSDRHHDVAQLADGTDVVVMVGRASNGSSVGSGVGYFRMSNGTYTHVLPGPFNGGHVSGRCYEVRDYVILSSYAAGTFPGQGTVFALQLSTGKVRPYMQIHSVSGGAYDAEPQAAPSPDMACAIAAITWDGGPIGALVGGVDVVTTSLLP